MNIINQGMQMVQNVANAAQGAFNQATQKVQGLFIDKLAPELAPLQNAEMLRWEPVAHVFCCSCGRLPQYFYKLIIGQQTFAHIMHGLQDSRVGCCDAFAAQCKQICGKELEVACKLCIRKCSLCCELTLFCLTCKPLRYCCGHMCSWVGVVEPYDDYENVLEVKHIQTSLGWGDSEKDGLYVNKKEFAIGAFYRSAAKPFIDWVLKDPNNRIKAHNSSKTQNQKELIERSTSLPGVPTIEDKVFDEVTDCLACTICTPPTTYKQELQSRVYDSRTYAIHYQGKYVGRYIYGNQYKPILQMCCPFFNVPGYGFRDNCFLLDNFDNLLYQFEQLPLSICQAFSDKQTGKLYKVVIRDPKGESIGHMIKHQEKLCCGCKKKWVLDLTVPKQASPVHKLLLAYYFPFLNERWMNVWNTGDGHNLEPIENDRHYPTIQRGQDFVLLDRVVDRMSYRNVKMQDVPGILGQAILGGKSREEASNDKWSSLNKNPSMQREYIRKKRLVVKHKLMEKQFAQNVDEEEQLAGKVIPQ